MSGVHPRVQDCFPQLTQHSRQRIKVARDTLVDRAARRAYTRLYKKTHGKLPGEASCRAPRNKTGRITLTIKQKLDFLKLWERFEWLDPVTGPPPHPSASCRG